MTLWVENVNYHYAGGADLYENINLTVEPGEIVGISGYSGCGKSTLARIMGGMIRPKRGRVSIDGQPINGHGFQQVQLISQHPEKAVNPRWHMRRILEESYVPDEELIALFGIQEQWMKRWPIEVSGGELQRFCIVRALNPKTRYIIADEMTTMLDAITQADIWGKMVKIVKERHMGMIVISHDRALVNRLCDRHYQFVEKRLVEEAR